MKRLLLMLTLVIMLFLAATPVLAADTESEVFDLEQLWYLGGVPLVLALVQLVKVWVKDTRLYPVFAVVFGVALDVVIGFILGQPLVTSIIVGAIVGLTAGGLYSGATTYTKSGGSTGTTPGT